MKSLWLSCIGIFRVSSRGRNRLFSINLWRGAGKFLVEGEYAANATNEVQMVYIWAMEESKQLAVVSVTFSSKNLER